MMVKVREKFMSYVSIHGIITKSGLMQMMPSTGRIHTLMKGSNDAILYCWLSKVEKNESQLMQYV